MAVPSASRAVPRYRFHEFILSPRRRALVRNGRDQPLIPRYFDLLVFLVERRGEAVHRRDIFETVWRDVIVSDSALTQAIRTIRRVLDDDPREPRFVRTVSRHGYQFVCADVVEEDDDGGWPRSDDPKPLSQAPEPPADLFEPLLEQIARLPASRGEEEDQREAAERLHVLGTAQALERLGTREHHAMARALLRDTRWEAPEAGPVNVLGAPAALLVAWHLVRLRLRRAAGLAARRWMGAAIGGGAAGACGGALGGLLLALSPGSAAPLAVVPVLALIGAACGSWGAAGVGAGLSVAESALRSRRLLALAGGGAAGGGAAGLVVQLLGQWSLTVLVGIDLDMGGAVEGLAIGGAAGIGYGAATSRTTGGLASPRGRGRWSTAGLTAAACGLAALGLAVAGHVLVGGTVHALAQASAGAQAVLTPLGRLVGEPDFGPATAALISMGEGVTFGLGLALGLTRRPSS
jgi:DNA-binding winged helix-turn-helix (wHTH) protein